MAARNPIKPLSIVIGLLVIAVIAGAVIYFNNNSTTTTQSGTAQVAGAQTQTKTANNPKANVNKRFAAAALDGTGKTSKTKIDMNIKTVEKSQDILIKGQPATAKQGSAFLVLQVELKNPSNERLVVAPLDLIRLIVDDQKRAAEIYTEELPNIRGSVVVEPDSTKVTRVGFVLTPEIASKKFKLQVGEVNSPDKQIVDLNI
jgi:hypothetical protein